MSEDDWIHNWRETIYCRFDNKKLKEEIEKCAKEMGCTVYYGETDSSDIIESGCFVSIVDRNLVGEGAWNSYISFCKESEDDTPCLVLCNSEDFLYQDRTDDRFPDDKYVEYFNADHPQSYSHIVRRVKEIKEHVNLLTKPDSMVYNS